MKDKIQIICVEDGSVDIDELQDIQDGKVIVYRQGARPPFILEIEKPTKETTLDKRAFALDIEKLLCRFMLSCDKSVVNTIIAEYEKILKLYGVDRNNER